MFDNHVTRMLSVEIPIVQAPMGWIARAQLASAVSNAGALGIIETSSPGAAHGAQRAPRSRAEVFELGYGVRRVYFEGDLEAGVALSGQVAGRIEAIVPVAEVIARTVREFHETVESLAKNHLRR